MLIEIIAIKLIRLKQQYKVEMGMNQTEHSTFKHGGVRGAKPPDTLENFYVAANENY